MKKAVIEFAVILIITALVAFLSACNGGTVTGNESLAEGSQLSEGEIKFSNMGIIPLVQGLAIESYDLEIQNGESQEYLLKDVRVIDPLTKRQDRRLGVIEASSCSKILANTNCSIIVKPLLDKSGSFILEADLVNEMGKSTTLRQLIRVSDKIASNNGVVSKNDVTTIVTSDGKYSLVIPIVLTEDFDSLKTSNGSLICNHGYSKNSSCSYLLSGSLSGSNTLLETKITGYRGNQIVSVNSYSTFVTNSVGANLLLSQPTDISITSTAEDATTNLTVFNNGNYTANNLKWKILSGSMIVDDETTTCQSKLAPHTECNISLKGYGQLNGTGSVEVSYTSSNTADGGDKSAIANILYILSEEATPIIAFNHTDGGLENTLAGATNQLKILVKNNGRYDLTNLKFDIAAKDNTGTFELTGNKQGYCSTSSQRLKISESCTLEVSYTSLDVTGVNNNDHGNLSLSVTGNYTESNNTVTNYIASSVYPYSTNFFPTIELLRRGVANESSAISTTPGLSYPGARTLSHSFTDKDGNFWLFGGLLGRTGRYNDFWKYDVRSNQWSKFGGANGANNPLGSYGTIGVVNPTNYPGNRHAGGTWVDKDGNFWMFGGVGTVPNQSGVTSSGQLNDLWKYNVTSNEWVWVKGSKYVNQVGSFGTKYECNITNQPSGRAHITNWIDKDGNLWLYGGYGYGRSPDDGTNKIGSRNDLWKYNINDNCWTWMGGDDRIDIAPSYGTKNIASDTNYPGSRLAAVSFADKDGNLWVFGGSLDELGDEGAETYRFYSDLWKYDVEAKQWTWINGWSKISWGPTYGGVEGVFDKKNQPGGRRNSCGGLDKYGNLWVYGGFGIGIDNNNNHSKGILGDFWKYNFKTDMWARMGGSQYVNQPVSSLQLGGRSNFTCGKDKNGNAFMFGGHWLDNRNARQTHNEFWKFM